MFIYQIYFIDHSITKKYDYSYSAAYASIYDLMKLQRIDSYSRRIMNSVILVF